MSEVTLGRRLAGEGLGTAFLLATVVGSGIMAERLAGGNVAVALLGNTIPTGAILVVLILVLGPVSGAHFNPAVSLAFALRRQLPWRLLAAYGAAQLAGAILGVWAAHAMFDVSLIQVSTTVRTGGGQWFAELVATFGLVLTILGCLAGARRAVPYAVGLYITAAYWFTASTSFANPAVTIARAFTDSFAGIAPGDAPAFILAQLAGAGVAVLLAPWLFAAASTRGMPDDGRRAPSRPEEPPGLRRDQATPASKRDGAGTECDCRWTGEGEQCPAPGVGPPCGIRAVNPEPGSG